MPDRTPDQLAAELRELADQVARLDDEPTTEPPVEGAPAKPTGLACVIGPDGKPVLTWDDPGNVDNWDVLDLANSGQPVKATVTVPRSVRSPVKPGTPARRYAVRARNAAGESEVSDSVDVPATGDTKPDPPGKPTPSGKHPSDVLDLRNWTIMLPTGFDGDPDNAYMIGKSVDGVFFVEDGAVVFRTDVVNGVHSSGSKYPRTEAREMVDDKWTKAAWPSTGPRFLEADLAIDTSHLTTRKRINGLQIHDGGDDVCQVMLNRADDPKIGKGLGLAHSDGQSWESIDLNYVDGTRFTCRIAVEADRIKVAYNGRQVVDIPKRGTGWYWKLGSYAQTGGASTNKEPAGSYAQVKVWSFRTGAA